ncbi:alpha-amylase [Aspergillus homomorphus CBS 101889]|uniref:alpha-amylase n=1 Tax=Aspergillus homomorphus (strain CBS 101889) TaxID=1450537 RepID=A0A395HMN5_ASPHC|nr:alpha-amylase [Aspergillus homomorphus CBS 101889]RAL07534.1 alpha-amylase [Aspergillus homomorphus CBS 101889]
MTDRFARTDGSTTAPCNTTAGLYCGGTWRGLIGHLDYIEGMGFDAVMISPIIKNIEERVPYGEAYHGYWAEDLYALNHHFGTEQDLRDLSKALHDRGMYLMMDTVINNMAYVTNGADPATSIDYSKLHPFNDAKYYHPYCKITDYNDYPLAQSCWTGDDIVALPDLKTEDSTVQRMLNDWVQEVMSNYSIDGLRLDAAKHITPSYLADFQKAADCLVTGEVFDQSVDTICSYQDDLTSVPNYPIYYALLDAFTLGNTTTLPNRVEEMKHSCPNVSTLATFSENHDVARFASLKDDLSLAKNILTFTLLSDGIPMIYQGQEQHLSGAHDPLNREALWLTSYDTQSPLYRHIATLNALRHHAIQVDPAYIDTLSYPVYRGSSEMAFRKGREGRQVVIVLSTQGSTSGAYSLRMTNGYQPSVVVVDVLTCRSYTVSDIGELDIAMDKGEPRVLYPMEMMEGSGLCGFERRDVSEEDFRKTDAGGASGSGSTAPTEGSGSGRNTGLPSSGAGSGHVVGETLRLVVGVLVALGMVVCGV